MSNPYSSRSEFRHHEIARVPRGYQVRTKTLPTGTEIRLAYPPGARRTGSGRLVSILRPKNPYRQPSPEAALDGLEMERLALQLGDRWAIRPHVILYWLEDTYRDYTSALAGTASLREAPDSFWRFLKKGINPSEVVRDSAGQTWMIDVRRLGREFIAQAFHRGGKIPHADREVLASGASEEEALDRLIEKIEPNPSKEIGTADEVTTHGGLFGFGKEKDYYQYKILGKTYQVRKTEKSKRKRLPVNVSVDTATGKVYLNPAKQKTREQVEAMHRKAIAFMDRVGAEDPNGVRNMSVDEYAAHKGITLTNPRPPLGSGERFAHLEREIERKGGARDAAAVAAAAGRRKYGKKRFQELAAAGRRRAHNPEDQVEQAARTYEQFHGRPPKEIIETQQAEIARDTFWVIGPVIELRIFALSGTMVNLDCKHTGIKAAASPEGTQIYFMGGDQDLDHMLQKFGTDTSKDFVELGELRNGVYDARKWQTHFDPALWDHKFGDEGGIPPLVMYDRLNKRMYLIGGTYHITRAGIRN